MKQIDQNAITDETNKNLAPPEPTKAPVAVQNDSIREPRVQLEENNASLQPVQVIEN